MIDDKVLKQVIESSLDDDIGQLEEAYVAQPKTYPQVTDLLSTQTKDTHSKLYQDYVSKLSSTSMKVDTAKRLEANSATSAYRSLKGDEADLHNAVYLHELFFSNCFDPHSEIFMDTLAYMRLARDFGTFEQWQSDFLACAMSGREGWVVTGYSTFLKRYVNTFVDGHSHGTMLGLFPVIAVDVWAHAYYRDYLDDRKSYVIAMMTELNWDVIEARFKKAEAINEALK